jgi:hypothetical protein
MPRPTCLRPSPVAPRRERLHPEPHRAGANAASMPNGCCSCSDTGTSSSTWPRPTRPPSTTTSGRGFSPPEYHHQHCSYSVRQHRSSTTRHQLRRPEHCPSLATRVLREFDEFSHGNVELRKWRKEEILTTEFEARDEIGSRRKRRSQHTHL